MSYFSDKARALCLAFGMALALFSLGATAAGPAAAQDEGPWLVTEAGGGAWLQSADGATKPLRKGDEVGPGSRVGAGANGQVTLSRGGTAMTLSPNGETEIPADSDQGPRTSIFQRLGTLLLKVDKRPEQHFEVDTPFLAAVVKGTTFTVSVQGQASAVHVVEGAVEVGAFGTGEVALVRPGQTATVSPQTSGGLKVSGRDAPSGTAGGGDQQGQNGGDRQDGAQGDQAAAGTGKGRQADEVGADEVGAKVAGKSAEAPRGNGKGLKLERAVGWDSIDIATVSDGFVSAAPLPDAARAGVGQGKAANGRAVAAGNNGGNGSVVFGQSAGGGPAAIGAGAAAAGSNGLGAAIQATAADLPAENHGQAVKQSVQSLLDTGSPGNGVVNGVANGVAGGIPTGLSKGKVNGNGLAKGNGG